jgi:hypothetical protein
MRECPLSNSKTGFHHKEHFLKNVSNIITLCVGILASSAVIRAAQPAGVTIQGDAHTISLSPTSTLGSANIRLKTALGPEVRLQCGILGVLQGVNSNDGSLNFIHTVTCDDRSVFILNTHTVISPQPGTCSNGGIKATFHETSVLVGFAGPYANATGNVTIDGTIDCGFNTMTITGSLTPAP